MLGALIKAAALLDFNNTVADLQKKLTKKFASKPEVVEGNLNAVKRAYNEVKGE